MLPNLRNTRVCSSYKVIVMHDGNVNSESLDSMLDIESDEEFGMPVFRDPDHHHASEVRSGDLSNWSAADFSSMYVRFKPHLERHAKRYISNPVQAEEIVHDAFLYLMTTLPELDSELGVLKFLKWKVKLLCFDVMGSASNRRESSVADFSEEASDSEDLSLDLERAEDNAVIRMALAKLNPRHREALLASVYEEKSAEQVGEQMSLSPNAARQLVFRARKAFRIALVGETDVKGKTVNELLSIATKKAMVSARNGIVQASVFLVLVGLGAASLLAVSNQVQQESNVAAAESSDDDYGNSDGEGNASRATEAVEPSSAPTLPKVGESQQLTSEDSVQAETTDFVTLVDQSEEETLALDNSSIAEESVELDLPKISPGSMDRVLTTSIENAGIYENSYAARFAEIFSGESIEVFGGTGISAFLDYDPTSRTVEYVLYQVWADGQNLIGVAEVNDISFDEEARIREIVVVSSGINLVTENMNIISDSPLRGKGVVVTMKVDANGKPTSASLRTVAGDS